MFQVTDQIGQVHHFKKVPTRIVSLVPSITYLLHRLDLDDALVGITRFCKLPPHYKKQKTIVGGTKQINFERIKQLNPDIFLVSKEENTKEMVEILQQIAPVFVSDVSDCTSNQNLIHLLGILFDKYEKAYQIQNEITNQQLKLKAHKFAKSLNTLYLIWQNPWMTVGGDTFINQMMQLAGFQNIYADKKRYPTVDLAKLNPDDVQVILLSSEPFPFKEKHQKELQKQFPNTHILLVEGEAFTWFGAYTVQGFSYLSNLLKQLSNAH